MAKIKHIAIATAQPETTAKFYKEVFELQMVGKLDSDNAEGYYLSDGNINLAILRFKNDTAAGEELGSNYEGIHHIGFQVDDLAEADARLRKADSLPRKNTNAVFDNSMGKGHGGRNVRLEYDGPDGVLIDISHGGWVGTELE